MSDWFPMKTKFVGTCKICSKVFEVGDDILWKKGEGVKCPTKCEATSVYEDVKISSKEWKDFTKYSMEELNNINNCQCCGTPLDKTKDSYINDDKKTCERCFLA